MWRCPSKAGIPGPCGHSFPGSHASGRSLPCSHTALLAHGGREVQEGQRWPLPPPLPGPAHPGALMNRLPCVALQVEGRSQQRDPGHHCLLQSESEAGGVSGRVSAPVQPGSPQLRGEALPPAAGPPVLPPTLRVNRAPGLPVLPLLPSCFSSSSSAPLPCRASEAFSPSLAPSVFPSFSSTLLLSVPLWAHGWREAPRSLRTGVSRRFCAPCHTWGYSTHPHACPC